MNLEISRRRLSELLTPRPKPKPRWDYSSAVLVGVKRIDSPPLKPVFDLSDAVIVGAKRIDDES
jgi:hypothetical protein